MTLTCFACKKVFDTGPMEEDAFSELSAKLKHMIDEVVVVCDPCYRRATVTSNWKPTAMKAHLN